MALRTNKAAPALLAALLLFPLLAGCATTPPTNPALAAPAPMPARPPDDPNSMDALIAKHSRLYGVPEALIRRVIVRESNYNPKARNGLYYGLMQISYATAQSMGYRGPAAGLLDADTNMRYAVKYLAGAYLVGDQNHDSAVANYARGYYYVAKSKGLLGTLAAQGLR